MNTNDNIEKTIKHNQLCISENKIDVLIRTNFYITHFFQFKYSSYFNLLKLIRINNFLERYLRAINWLIPIMKKKMKRNAISIICYYCNFYSNFKSHKISFWINPYILKSNHLSLWKCLMSFTSLYINKHKV